MQRLTIEYQLNGPHPGYGFVGPVEVSERVRRELWRGAMPRGQGWADPRYAGARSLKVFPVDNGRRVAASVVRVTDMVDELGRGGIQRAQITLMRADAYRSFVAATAEALPDPVKKAAEARLASTVWRRVLNKAVLRAKQQIVLTHRYQGAEHWAVVEALVLRLVSAPGVRLVEGWGRSPSFTTLALGWREESRIVALPREVAQDISSVPVIEIW